MNENDILGLILLVAFIAMTIYFQVKSKQLASQSNISSKK